MVFYCGARLVSVPKAPAGRLLLDRHSGGVLDFFLGGPGPWRVLRNASFTI